MASELKQSELSWADEVASGKAASLQGVTDDYASAMINTAKALQVAVQEGRDYLVIRGMYKSLEGLYKTGAKKLLKGSRISKNDVTQKVYTAREVYIARVMALKHVTREQAEKMFTAKLEKARSNAEARLNVPFN